MKRIALVLLAPLLFATSGAAAQGRADDGPGHVRFEEDPGERELYSIRTRGGETELVLTRERVFARLAEDHLEEVDRELRQALKEEHGEGHGAFASAVASSALETLVNMRIGVDRDEIESVRYEDGALRFEYVNGDGSGLEGIKVDDRPMLESFHERDAREFVRRFAAN